MTDEEIAKRKEYFNKLEAERKHYQGLREELATLKKHPVVKRMHAIKEELASEREFSEDKAIMEAFAPVAAKTSENNNVYVYLYTYPNSIFFDNMIGYDNPATYVSVFANLETGEHKEVSLLARPVFEEENTIVFMSDKIKFPTALYQDFQRLRLWFFKQLLNEEQDVVVRKLTNPKTIKEILA